MLTENAVATFPRREFVRTIFVGVATAAGGFSGWTEYLVGEAQAADVPFPDGQFSFRVSDYPPLATDLGSISLEIPDLPNILVTRIKAGEFVAVTSVCTHQGCSVEPYNPDFGGMPCPCHRSLYAPDGTVLGGPAPKPLYRYKLTYDGKDLITLDLVKFSYVISAEIAPVKVHGRKRLGISFHSESLHNYAIMFKPSLRASDWTQVSFSQSARDELTDDLFMGTDEGVTLYVDMPSGTGIFTVVRYRLLGG